MHCSAVLLLLVGVAEAFRICAFNAQRLTLAKVAREHVMDTLVRILARCDIMVLQEVVDSSGSAVSLLLRELNRFDGSGPYTSLSSPLLGRSTYMEKYVYIYRSQKTQVLDHYVYDDKDDLFAREPFVAKFTLPSKGRKGRGVALLWGSGKGGLAGSIGGLVTEKRLCGEGPGMGGSPPSLGPCSPSQLGVGPPTHHSEGCREGAERPV